MEITTEKKTLKRKAEEISNESDAVRIEHTKILKAEKISNKSDAVPMENNETPTVADNSIVGRLCEDMVMGEVMPLIPWYNRPIMNRWCADAMTHSFPYYARLQNPRILSNCLVLYHPPAGSENPNYNSLCIWVYSENEGTLLSLPVPAIPQDLGIDAKFVRDDNGDRIYSFTPIKENGQEMYDVRVVDLREGNIRWKKLPPLPSWEEHSVWSCVSFDNGGCCTSYHILWTEDKEDDYVSTLNTRNDITESQSQWQPELGASASCAVMFKSMKVFGWGKEQIPIYLEINIPSRTGAHSPKALYKFCADRHYSTDYSDTLEMPDFLLMQYHSDGHNEASCILYYIRSFGGNGFRKVDFYKVKLDSENSRRLEDEEGSEWQVFLETWWHNLRADEEITATKVLWKRFPEWYLRTFNIDEVVDTDAIKIAPRGPLYVYSFKTAISDPTIFD